MNWIGSVIDWLQGKKTYLIAASAILTAVIAYLNKSISLTELVAAIYAAIAGMSLKAGQNRIETEQKK